MPRKKYHVPAKPKNDNEHLELIARIIFIIGFKYEIVEQRWPKIKKAFKNFDSNKVKKLHVEKLKEADGMIRNGRKIQMIIDNADICSNLIKEHGSMKKWVSSVVKAHKKDVLFQPSLKEEAKQFAGIGETTSEWVAYVFAEGKSKPEVKYARDHRRETE